MRWRRRSLGTEERGAKRRRVWGNCNVLPPPVLPATAILATASPSVTLSPLELQAHWDTLSRSRFTPAHAHFWRSRQLSNFMVDIALMPELSFDRLAWADAFKWKRDTLVNDFDAIEARELEIIALDGGFGRALAELRGKHEGWPFMDSRLDCARWLEEMLIDDDTLAPNLYFVLSRGFNILPAGAAADFPDIAVGNYESAKENADVVSVELERLIGKGFVVTWDQWRQENNYKGSQSPKAILALGVVFKKDKARFVIDGSAPFGRSLNDAMEPPPTTLPSIAWAMRAMSHHGYMFKLDFVDAFLNMPLSEESVPLCAIEWEGKLYVYKSLGFGFKSGPHQQQQTTLAIVRVALRRMRGAGLSTPVSPSLDHSYPVISAAPHGVHAVNVLLSFLDDTGGFASSRAAAWLSFVHYITTCFDLGYPVACKEGKTESPATFLHFLGFDVDCESMTVSLHPERVDEIRDKLITFASRDSMSLKEGQSLVGILVFASTVIRIGRLYYRALLDAINDLGPDAPSSARIKIDGAIKESLGMWSSLMTNLNAVNANVQAMRPTVPGEIRTDASLQGWGWIGMGKFDYGAWPDSWIQKMGVWNPSKLEERIWICELEAWGVLHALRSLCKRMGQCRVVVKVDNLPVVYMLRKLSAGSPRCVRVLREIAWICAAYDIELAVEWIDTHSNWLADTFSRKFCPKLTLAEWDKAVEHFHRVEECDPTWAHWEEKPPARPELLTNMVAACYYDFAMRANTRISKLQLDVLQEFY